MKLVPAVAYHFCLNLPATFSQPRTSIISGPSIFSEKLYPLYFSFLTGAAKPKLIRQTAILADGDSTSSGKSVTFKVSEEDIAITSTECFKKTSKK